MKGKLIKDHSDYHLVDDKRFIIGTTDKSMLSCTDKQKLSLKNCQAIERGYDLDELAISFIGVPTEVYDENDMRVYNAVKYGFQKAVELMGDKKFSDENILKAFITGVFTDENSDHDFEFSELMKDLQQTEWDVEIMMEEKSIEDIQKELGTFGHDEGLTEAEYNEYVKTNSIYKPKLDADGCLILKRVI